MNERLAVLHYGDKFAIGRVNDAMNILGNMVRPTRGSQRDNLLRVDQYFLIVRPGQLNERRALRQ